MEQNLDEQPEREGLWARIARLPPAIKIASSFVLLILLGSLLLLLPISTKEGVSVSFIDALFTSTSAVCVTGLASVILADTFNTFGQIVILLLIQFGGLGFMTIASLLMIIAGKKITLSERLTLREAYNQDNLSGMVKLTKNIILLTLVIELSGAVLLSFAFVPIYGAKGIYYAIFHSVSAFCNSGYDILGSSSLIPWQENVLVTLSISYLIILGGIGFTVIMDIVRKRRFKRFMTHTKIVLLVTGCLLLFSTALILVLEYNNPKTIGNMSFGHKLLASFFQAVVPRTAGFCSIDQSAMTDGSKILTMFNMFIGASSGSAGGGIKTTTLLVLIMTVVSYMQSKNDVEIMKHKIDKLAVYRTLTVTLLSLTAVILCFSVLYFTLPEDGRGVQCLFEAVSAFSTSGLSAGITEISGTPGRILLIITMFIGRVGPVSLVLSMLVNSAKRKNIVYPDGQIIVG